MASSPSKPRYRKAIGPRLQPLLTLVFALFALITLDSAYLAGVTFLEWRSGETLQNRFYLSMFLVHLVLGLAITLPVIAFGIAHLRNTYNRPNRRAVRAGYALFVTSLVLLGSGLALMRIDGVFELRDPQIRRVTYWIHALTPLLAIWLFILHRLAGRKIRWRVGATWAAVAAAVTVTMMAVHARDPRSVDVAGPASGEQYFFPSLARTASGNFIPERVLAMDSYCQECHPGAHESWSNSVHRFSSFNNPAYLASVRETRQVALERDGDVQASRFCAGCHDPVPFFSGAFDDPHFDDRAHPTAHAGITCTACHAITNINSPRGNADYTIEEPLHYPFTFSENRTLSWINRQLVKAKPAFHKATFLKPLHESTEFCGSCHKVHLPEELNHYKWLRGQNHYDSFLLSGVSGHGASSFYYPETAETNCNGCHMELVPSTEFGADDHDGSGRLTVHDHQFPSANTAIPHLLGLPDSVNAAHREMLRDCARLDIVAVRRDGTLEGELVAPIRPRVPALAPGESVLIDVVIRTLTLGHLLTEGTADSNELWLELDVRDARGSIGASGGRDDRGAVDPMSHFVNAYVLDRDGNRIERRNAQDIFVPLYSNQIPPGAADVVHYRLDLPDDVVGPLSVRARLLYRKFDTTYMSFVTSNSAYVNDLPVSVIATDEVSFPTANSDVVVNQSPDIPLWQRWNDYGIGLLRKGDSGSSRGELRQAEHAFSEVETLGRPDGPLNLARVYVKEGRLEEAVDALGRAAAAGAPPWTVDWFTGIVNRQNGFLEEAVENFTAIASTSYPSARARGFDFSKDYRVLGELGATLVDLAALERGDARRANRDRLLREAVSWFERSLEIDPERAQAHYNLYLALLQLGDTERAERHRALHEKYRPDDNARDRAVAAARRRDPAANHNAEAIVIHDLTRPDRFPVTPRGTDG